MKIAYGSDFHFEFIYSREVPLVIDRWEIEEDTDLMIIAGDLHVGAKNVLGTLEFIYNIHNIPILYVPGNHEYYGSSFQRENRRFHRADIEGVTILESKHIEIDKINFFGCAGNIDGSFEHIYKSKHGILNDFHQISDFDDHDILGKREYAFMHEAMWQSENTKIAITHSMPSPLCINPKYATGNILNPCFANDWGDIIYTHNPEFWVCGHTHDAFIMNIDETQVVCNPLGYPHEKNKWKWEYIYVYE